MTSDALRRRVLEANRRFYDAFEALDMDAMEDCWEHSSRVACLHPGGPWLRGWEEVRQSWETIMSNTGYIEFEVDLAHVEIADPVAWVTCVERITSAGGGGPSTADVAATNVFVVDETGWHMVLHHASPVIRPAPMEE